MINYFYFYDFLNEYLGSYDELAQIISAAPIDLEFMIILPKYEQVELNLDQ
jgi:hypothetical protein